MPKCLEHTPPPRQWLRRLTHHHDQLHPRRCDRHTGPRSPLPKRLRNCKILGCQEPLCQVPVSRRLGAGKERFSSGLNCANGLFDAIFIIRLGPVSKELQGFGVVFAGTRQAIVTKYHLRTHRLIHGVLPSAAADEALCEFECQPPFEKDAFELAGNVFLNVALCRADLESVLINPPHILG